MKLITFILLVTFVAASYAEEEDQNTEKVTEKLKTAIADQISKLGSRIDPLVLDDQTSGFIRKVGPFNVTGKIGLQNLKLTGLKDIRVLQDAFRKKTKFGNTELHLVIGVGPLNLEGRGVASFMGLGPKVGFQGRLAHIDASAVLSYHPPLEQVFVKSFEVGELAGLKFKLLGPGYVTPFFANQFIKAALATLNPLIKSTVERQGRNVLERSVKDSDFVKTVITDLA